MIRSMLYTSVFLIIAESCERRRLNNAGTRHQQPTLGALLKTLLLPYWGGGKAVGRGLSFAQRPQPFCRNEEYQGTWFEIGRIQTAGGAIFQQNCVCTQLIIDNASNGDLSATNSCRDLTPQGQFISNATGQLIDETPPGHWQQTFFPGIPGVNYTVIMIGEDYSVEYDCGESLFGTNYCIHILSKTPSMDPLLFAKLVNASIALDLNPLNLPVNMAQAGCW